MSVTVKMPETYLEFEKGDLNHFEFTLHRKHGVYILYNELGAPIYVGRSKDVKRRLTDHIKGRNGSEHFYREISRIRVYLEDNPFFVDVYEAFLINELKPAYNLDRVYFTERYDEIDEKMFEIDVRLREIDEEITEYEGELSEEEANLGDHLFAIDKIAAFNREKDRLRRELAALKRRSRKAGGL